MNKNHEQPNEFFKPKYIYVLADCGDRKGYRFVTAVEREGCLYQGSDEEETELFITDVDMAKMCRPLCMSEEASEEVLAYLLSHGIMAYVIKTHQEIRTQFFASLSIAINNYRKCVEAMSKDRGQLMEALRKADKKCEYCAITRDKGGKRPCPRKDSECQTCSAKCPCAECVDNCNWTWDGGVTRGSC